MSRTNSKSDTKLNYSQLKSKSIFSKFLSIIVISMLLTSCAYYNYLYHAKKHFEKGEKELREQPEGNEAKPKRGAGSAYKSAIESAGRMLEFYPDSRWEEEALLLLAKSYYRTNQYRKAISKVDELFGKYPNSELLNEAVLWKGMSLLRVAQPDSARAILSDASNSDNHPELILITHKALGDYYYSEERWETAKKEYTYIVNSNHGEEWLKSRAIMKISDCLRRLDRNEEALDLLSDILSRKPRGSTKFEAAFQHAKVLYDVESYEEAYEEFQKLLRDGTFESEFPRVELEVARCEVKNGEFEDGRDRLEEIIEEKSRGEIAAQAQYELGMIYWNELDEIAKSHEAFRNVKSADNKSLYKSLADSMINQIEILSDIWQRMGFTYQQLAIIDSAQAGLRQIFPFDTVYNDTLKAAFKSKIRKKSKSKTRYKGRDDPIQRMVDEARKAEQEKELALDSAIVDTSAPLDSIKIAELLLTRELQHQQVVLEIAIHYMFIDAFRDSSLYYFDIYLSDDLEDEDWGKAVSSISYLHLMSGDSVRQKEYDEMIIERITEGRFLDRARRNLGLESLKAEVDTFDVYFKAAENLWLIENNPQAAREVYVNISEIADSLSDNRERALYAAAYLSRHIFGEDSIAQGYFKIVQEEFSGTDRARSARNAINLAHVDYTGKQHEDKRSKREDLNQFDEIPRDVFIDQYMQEDFTEPEKIYDANEVDDIPELTTPNSMLESLQQSFYPFRAQSENLSGSVELEFLVGIRGDVTDVIVVTEEPAGYEFGDAALEVLKQLHYRGGRYRGDPVTVRMNQRFAFRPPR